MKINECVYCGMTAFSNDGICPACQEALGQTETAQETNQEVYTGNVLESTAFVSNDEPFQENFESADNIEPAPTEIVPETNNLQSQSSTADWKRCPICNAGIAQYRDVCSRCATVSMAKKKSNFGKFVKIFAVLLVIAGGIFYFYEDKSANGIMRKYARVTGTSGNLVYETFIMKGDATITATGLRSSENPSGATVFADPSKDVVLSKDTYYFDMFFKKPNKTLIDFYKISVTPNSPLHDSAFSQGFNGTNGWKYMKLFNQPAKLEDGGDAFGEKKMGVGLEDYETIEILSEATRAEYGDQLIKSFDELKTFQVDGVATPSEKKVYLFVKRTKSDGKKDESVLVFDEKSGFLVGMLKKDIVEGTPVVSKIFAEDYKKFWMKEKGFLGTSGKFILVPALWKFNMNLPKPVGNSSPLASITITIELKVESLSPDITIDDAVFEKPVK